MSCYIGTIFTTYIKVVNSPKTIWSNECLCKTVNESEKYHSAQFQKCFFSGM